MTDVNASQDDIAFAVRLQPGGKIIAVGTASQRPASIVVIRYNANGTLDSTFGATARDKGDEPALAARALSRDPGPDGSSGAGRSIASSEPRFPAAALHTTHSSLARRYARHGGFTHLWGTCTPIPSGTRPAPTGSP